MAAESFGVQLFSLEKCLVEYIIKGIVDFRMKKGRLE